MTKKTIEDICTLEGKDGALYKIQTHPGWNLCTVSYRETLDEAIPQERLCPYQGQKLRHILENRSIVKKGFYLPCKYRKKPKRSTKAYKIEQ